jgi:hypothetical protein
MKATFDADFSNFRNEVVQSVDKLDRFERTSGVTSNTLERLHTSVARFDSVFNSLGVHLSSEVRALQEIAEAANQTTAQLGALSTAGLVVGTGIAAWNLGRAIAQFGQADEVIANSTAKLLGWGDVAKEQAAAGADALAAASRRAGRAVTDMADALNLAAQAAADLKRQGAPDEGFFQVKERLGEIALVQQSGVLPQLTKDLQSHNFTLKELADRYVVSVEALQQYQRGLQQVHDFEVRRQQDYDFTTSLIAKAAAEDERRAALQRRIDAENKRGMEEYEAGLLREFELETKVWGDAIKMTDALNARLQAKLDLQTKYQTALALEAQQARDINTNRNLGPGIADPALDAATRRDAALRDLASSSAAAPGIDIGPIIQKIWQDFDEQILKRGAAAVAATPPVQVNVSGIMDPRTIDEITDAIMRRSGRLWPGR